MSRSYLSMLICLTAVLALGTIAGCGPGPGGSPEPGPDDEDSEVAVAAGRITAPNATIISRGQEYSGDTGVQEEGLVGIIQDGKAYLYHPAMGSAELSDYNSRRAVGYFLAETATGAGAGKSVLDSVARLAVGESETLSTGVVVRRSAQHSYTLTNETKRWVAVKAPAAEKPYFLLPEKNWVETNIITAFERILTGHFDRADSVVVPVNSESVEVYGSLARALSDPVTTLLFGGQLYAKAEEAMEHDATLFLRLNAVDFMTFTIEGIERITGLFPYECVDMVVSNTILDTVETLGVGWLTGDDELRGEFAAAMGRDLAQSAGGCVCSTASVGACETVSTFLDIVAALDWVIEDKIVGTWDVVTNSAYADVEGVEDNGDADDNTDDNAATEPLTCTAGADYSTANVYISGGCVRLSGLGGYGRPPYSYSWSTPADGEISRQEAPTVCPSQTTTYMITVTDSTGDTCTDTATVYNEDIPDSEQFFAGTVRIVIPEDSPAECLPPDGSTATAADAYFYVTIENDQITLTGFATSPLGGDGTFSVIMEGPEDCPDDCVLEGLISPFEAPPMVIVFDGTCYFCGCEMSVDYYLEVSEEQHDLSECGNGECESGETNSNCPEDCPSPGETLTLDLGGGVTMELVRIPAGTFMMGADEGWDDVKPVHGVTISRDFYIGRYEVTQAQWQAVMGSNPSYCSGCDNCPVEEVSWNDVVEFCDTLSGMTGYDIRLPSEAEWEYACRAGTTTEYSFGDDESDLGDYAWYEDNSGSQPHEVGTKLPNPWGLYDVHGNVWEWCNDWYDGDYYDVSPSLDPSGPSSGTNRVHRGGAWLFTDIALRSAFRAAAGCDNYTTAFGGFRAASGT